MTHVAPATFLDPAPAPWDPSAPEPKAATLVRTEDDLADLCDRAELLANVQADGSVIYSDHTIDIWAHADGIDFTDGRAGGTLDYGQDATVITAIIDAVRKAAQR